MSVLLLYFNRNIVHYLRLVSGEPGYWIGLTDLAHEGSWRWIKIPNMRIQWPENVHWAAREPNNLKNNEDCAEIGRIYGNWKTNDLSCNWNLYAICENNIRGC